MITYCSLVELNCCGNLGDNQICNNGYGVSGCEYASTSKPTILENAKGQKDLSKFKVDPISCDGWIVPPVVERWLKNLCHQHNALVDYLEA